VALDSSPAIINDTITPSWCGAFRALLEPPDLCDQLAETLRRLADERDRMCS
jgi:hypothetical protein